jgi:hypothetical protein
MYTIGMSLKGQPKCPDLTGEQFARLTVVQRTETQRPYRGQFWLCLCACGGHITTSTNRLRMGGCRSCGCLKAEANKGKRLRHGACNTTEYKIWQGMNSRCSNPRRTCYPEYGGRGIRVCDRWRLFENFLADMGPRPSAAHTIDRQDPNGNYEPDNCRWATDEEQGRTKRRSKVLPYQGQTLTASEWSRIVGIHDNTIRHRMKLGWPAEEILSKQPAAGGRPFKAPPTAVQDHGLREPTPCSDPGHQ